LLPADLPTEQRAAAAFDQAQLRIDFVRAVDGEIERRDLRERKQRDRECARLLLGLVRRARAAYVAQLAALQRFAEETHELRGRAARAEAEGHAAAHFAQRFRRGRDLHLVLVHQTAPAAPPCRGSDTAIILPRSIITACTSPIASETRIPWPSAASASSVAFGARSCSYVMSSGDACWSYRGAAIASSSDFLFVM